MIARLGAWRLCRYCCVAALLLIASVARAQAPATSESPTSSPSFPSTLRNLPLLWIPNGNAPQKLAGDLSDPVWKSAAQVPLGDVLGKDKPKYATTAYLFCTDDALFLGLRCEEPAIDQLKTTGGNIWDRDDIEVYLEPSRNTVRRPYHQLAFGAAGDQWEGRVHVYPHFGFQGINEAWTPKIEAAAARSQAEWTLEVKIPFEQLKMSEPAKRKATLWRLNLCRNRPPRGKDVTMRWSWSPLSTSYFHEAARFGYAVPESFASPQLIDAVTKRGEPDDAELRAGPITPEIRTRIEQAATALRADSNAGNATAAADDLRRLALHAVADDDAQILDLIRVELRRAALDSAGQKILDDLEQYQALVAQQESEDSPG